jgi:hypothetical protein
VLGLSYTKYTATFYSFSLIQIPIRLGWDINLALDSPVFIWVRRTFLSCHHSGSVSYRTSCCHRVRVLAQESCIDWFFVCDILVNFRTGIYINGEICFDAKVIAIDYAKCWLIIDLASSIPLDFFMIVTGGENLVLDS